MKALVIIPTYNEKENIEKIILTVLNLPKIFNILVIDDASKDGTSNIVKNLQTTNKDRLFLKERTGKLGLGTAYVLGFKWAIENNYDYVFEMDADFSHNPKDLLRMLDQLENYNYDLIVGSRYINGGNVKNWDKQRIFISKLGSLYTRAITFLNIKDTTAGFLGYKIKVLKTINLDEIKLSGYGFQIEMKFKAIKKGFKIKEIPITFIDRIEGVSKMNSKIVFEAMFGVLKMQLKYMFGFLKI